jgi:translation initiation factor 3 subunit D
MPAFSVPYVAPNPTSWGPPSTDEANPNAPTSKFAILPYAPFGRSDRLGRSADFTGRYQNYTRDNYRGKRDDNQEFQYKVDAEEQSSFQLVDTSKAAGASSARRFVTPAARRRQHSTRLRQVNARRQQTTSSFQNQSQKTRGGTGGRGGPPGRGGRGAGRGGRWGGRGRGNWQNRVDRQASVSVQPDWVQVEDLDLPKLTKSMTASTEIPQEQDVLWCGFLDAYNDAYDKVTARAPVALKRTETKEFYPVTTTDDPVLEKLAIDQVGNVFITDSILSHLMTCTRSVYPWDLVVQKLPNGTLFFDKRDNSAFDYLTVHETSYSPPTNDEPEGINTPERLGLEATMVHQNFTQQILKRNARKDMDLPNPFFDEDDSEGMEPASVAYRYRKFDLGDDITLVCRTELHGLVKKNQYMTAFCLNEYIPSALNWRDKFDTQFGAVLANELKNNSFQLAKWTAQSLLAGADQMKIGFVSRVAPKNSYEHQILGTQFYRPKDFAQQINVQEGNMWAMIRFFIQLLKKQKDGKYVLMRDPNKAILRLFSVPPETFEDDE